MPMTPTEALEWAADYAERNKLFVVPTKSNGYPVDSIIMAIRRHLGA